MRWKRIILFFLMIGVGAAFGLLYGWVINPLRNADTTLASLRYDYQADFVLMVAQIYQQDQDLDQAVRRITLLSSRPPGETVAGAIANARQLGYGARDLQVMSELSRALDAVAGSDAGGGSAIQSRGEGSP